MNGTNDRIKGEANEAIGKVKQNAGDALGSEKLKDEGTVQEVRGHGQKAVGDVKDAVGHRDDKL